MVRKVPKLALKQKRFDYKDDPRLDRPNKL